MLAKWKRFPFLHNTATIYFLRDVKLLFIRWNNYLLRIDLNERLKD